MLRNQLRPAVVMTLLLMVITGIIYPGAVTAVAHMFFPRQANGSLVLRDNGRVVGSALIGQGFAGASYFTRARRRRDPGTSGDSSGAHQQGADGSQVGGHADRAGRGQRGGEQWSRQRAGSPPTW